MTSHERRKTQISSYCREWQDCSPTRKPKLTVETSRPSDQASILLVKLGTHPVASGIANEIRELIPDVRILGIETNLSSAKDIGIGIIHERMVAAVDEPEWWEEHLFVDPDLYRKLRGYEGQWLRMMERLPSSQRSNSRFGFSNESNSESLLNASFRTVLRSIAMWDRILDANSVDALIFQNIPHNFWDAILYRVAEARNIPTLVFHINTRPFLDAIYIYEKIEQMGDLEIGRNLLSSTESLFGLSPDSNSRRARMSNSLVIGSLDQQSLTETRSVARFIVRTLNRLRTRRVSPRTVAEYLSQKRVSLIRDREWKSCISNAQIPSKFFMIELQRPGNATTLVKGVAYADPYQMIAHIADSLPDGWELLVRESSRPKSERRPRHKDFWNQIASIPRVYIANPNLNSEILLSTTTGVIELGYSTLAMRAITRDVAVIVLGLTHLKNVPNTYVIEDSKELSDVLGRIAAQWSSGRREIGNSKNLLDDWIDRTARSTIEGNLTVSDTFGVPDDEYKERLVRNTARVVAAWYLRRFKTSRTPAEESGVTHK